MRRKRYKNKAALSRIWLVIRKQSTYKTALSFCLALVLALQTVTFAAAASLPDEPGSSAPESSVTEAVYGVPEGALLMPLAESADKTAVLIGANQPFPLEVTQDGRVLDQNDTIHGRQPFSLKSVDIRVPVKGDASAIGGDPNAVDPSTVILHGDEVVLDRETYFPEVILPTATQTLTERSGLIIGTVTFSEEGIRIVFDGEERFFNGQGQNVSFGFESTAQADLTGMNYGDEKTIHIFGDSYTLENPHPEPAYSMTKRSNSNASENGWIYPADFVNGMIEWQVDVAAMDAFDDQIPLPLGGLKFYDALDPVQVGTYVEGSLRVNRDKVDPDDGTPNALAYTFPPDFGDKATVTFQTWIPKAKYYFEYRSSDNAWQTVTNIAELRDASDDHKLLSSNSWRVAFKPDWIQKSGTLDKRENTTDPRTVTWTIDVNKNYSKQGLKDFTITDALPNGLTFKSAEYQLWDAVRNDWSETKTSITPIDDVYSFGEINGPIRLVIVSTVTGTQSSFTNVARANWDLSINSVQKNDAVTGTTVSDSSTVTIGAHTLTKSAGSGDTLGLGVLPWRVTLTPQEALPDGAVYDLLVYGDASSIDLANVTASPEIDDLTGILNQMKGNNRENYYQRFQAGSFQSSDGLTHQVYTLSQGGKPVADLLRVAGYNTDAPASFTFNSLMTQWQHFANNRSTDQYNRVSLFEGANRTIDSTRPSIRVNSGVLAKEMLFATKPEGTNVIPNDVRSYIRNDSDEAYTLAAYDQVTKTVTFRLSVNMNGLKTEEMARHGGNHVASDIELVDTLPEGWEFVPYSEEQDFVIYQGSRADYGATVSAGALISDPSGLVSFSAAGNIGTFSFTKLESPYVILVKAKPTEAALRQYFETGEAKHEVTNTAELKITWGDEPTTVTSTRKVIVPMQTLGKSVTKPNAGVLEWTVNYSPPFEVRDGVYLQDTLGEGLALRMDENGNLSLRRPDMAVYRAKLTPSGTLERESDALDLTGPDPEVKVEAIIEGGATRLIFRMKDPNQLYQMVYQTEVTSVPASGKAGNEIRLIGDDRLKDILVKSESAVDNSDVGGSADTQAKLDLIKVDPDNKPLANVEFTLYTSDGTVVASGETGPDGKLSLFAKAGLYVLKQTYIDETTYLPTTKVYQVRVASTPWNPVWVDGVEVTAANPLIVPTPAQGKLTISNEVKGNDIDTSKAFEYTVTFTGEGKDGEYTYRKPDGTISDVKFTSGDKIFLKHGESVEFSALPVGLVYTVTQTDYTAKDGYTTSPGDRTYSDTVENKGDHKADFINERNVNKLTISNTVMGNGGDQTKEFEYTVIFEETGKDGSYLYTKSDGSTGTITSGADFKLKDGETLDILGLPENLKYTVTQKDYTADEYVTNPEERYRTGVMEGNDEIAPFTNVRVLKGGLLISNTVKGKDDDKAKLFKYTVTFTGEGADGSYDYEKSDGSKGTIKSGDPFELTDGQTFVVQGLPTYLEYTVTQVDYTEDGYVTDPKSLERTGTIPEKKAAEAHFVNTRPYLEGVLRDNNTGEVIPNASITVTNVKTGEKQTIRTDEKGEYSVPAEADTDYTITYTKTYKVGGKDVPVEFTQKANVDSSVTDETVPADITAVGIVLFKQLDGTEELFDNSVTGKMRIYLRDKDDNYIKENGQFKTFPIGSNGTFSIEGLSEQKYTMEVRYEAEDGQELLFKVAQLDVKANGELNISEELVDPYGTVYDETTGDATTGKKIDGAKVTLYYADTQRNRDNGRLPGTKVTLPPVPYSFPPNDNKSPEQDSDENGFYAYMVFPEADYYLVVTKPGYRTYTSDTISVEYDIVRHDVPMRPISSGGSSGGNPGDGNNGTGNGNPPGGDNNETDNGNPPDGSDNGTDNGNPPGGGDNGTDNGNPPDGSDNGTNNGNPPGGDDNGTDNGNPPEGNNGTGTGIDARPPEDDELDDVPKTGDSSASSTFYMVLALMSLIMLRICMPFRKKKHI